MRKQFMITINCDDNQDVLYDVSLETGIEVFMDGFVETGCMTKYSVEVSEIKF